MISFTFLSENKTENSRIKAEFGLSIYIETDSMNILFDTGASDIFYDNSQRLGVDLKDADACVISHGHYDHANGVPKFCDVNSKSRIYIHRNSFGKTYGAVNGKISHDPCGLEWTEAEMERISKRLHLTDGPVWLNEDVVISGTIPDLAPPNLTEEFYRLSDDGSFQKDDMSHEQFLAIRNHEDGIYIFSACSHKGIEAVLKFACELFPNDPIAVVVAGMHLFKADLDEIHSVAEIIKEFNPRLVFPVHCTGIGAIFEFKKEFGEKCIIATAGDSFRF